MSTRKGQATRATKRLEELLNFDTTMDIEAMTVEEMKDRRHKLAQTAELLKERTEAFKESMTSLTTAKLLDDETERWEEMTDKAVDKKDELRVALDNLNYAIEKRDQATKDAYENERRQAEKEYERERRQEEKERRERQEQRKDKEAADEKERKDNEAAAENRRRDDELKLRMKLSEEEHVRKLRIAEQEASERVKAQIEASKNGINIVGNVPRNSHLKHYDFPKFSGNRLDWTAFWDIYKVNVHDCKDLDEVEKFTQLINHLADEPKEMLANLQVTKANYETAIYILQEEYDRKDLLSIELYQSIANLKLARNMEEVRQLYIAYNKYLRQLETLGQDITQTNLVIEMMKKLPKFVIKELEQMKEEEQWTMENLLKTLKKVLDRNKNVEFLSGIALNQKEEQSTTNEKFKRDTFKKRFQGEERTSSKYTTVAASKKTGDSVPPRPCFFCGGPHWSDECAKFKTVEERKRQFKGCQVCLGDDHTKNSCKRIGISKPCVHCKIKGDHHRAFCPNKVPRPNTMVFQAMQQNVEPSTMIFQSPTFVPQHSMQAAIGEAVFMPTAMATIMNEDQSKGIQVRLLLDSGSTHTYITQRIAKELGLKTYGNQELVLSTFGATTRMATKATKFKIQFFRRWQGQSIFETMDIDAYIRSDGENLAPKTTRYAITDPNVLSMLQQYPLADKLPCQKEDIEFDIIMGCDYWSKVVLDAPRPIMENLYILFTKWGYVVQGSGTTTVTKPAHSTMLIARREQFDTRTAPGEKFRCEPDEQFTYVKEYEASEKFRELMAIDNVGICDTDRKRLQDKKVEKDWSLEEIGVHDKLLDSDDIQARDNFEKTIQFEDGRYYVTWPWKDEVITPPNNYGLAIGRLRSTYKRLAENYELLEKYNGIIEEQRTKGIIEEIPKIERNARTHYLAHHPVITPQKTTTKVRIVYDGSAKMRKHERSLNECLHRGEVILEDVCKLLLRFRLHRIALTADIEKAFLQIGLQEEERDVTRFLWIKDLKRPPEADNITIFRFCRVPFGVISSPFLLAATVRHHLQKIGTPIAKRISQDIYVDNMITGCHHVEEANKFYDEAKAMFQAASMNLREWGTNDVSVQEKIPENDRIEGDQMKILGIEWNIKDDSITIQDGRSETSERIISKRKVLSDIHSIYDPLGLAQPMTIPMKSLLRRLWKTQHEWDTTLDENLRYEWKQLRQQTRTITLPRWINTTPSAMYELHVFTDASKLAYACAVYLRRLGDQDRAESHLVFAKARLSPEQHTTPRLELLGAQIGAYALKYVRSAITLNVVRSILWTDSKCVLLWLASNKIYGTFVANRIRAIKRVEDLEFRYVTTDENPADLASRGITGDELKTSEKWWNGPKWLREPDDKWPTTNKEYDDAVQKKCDEEEKRKQPIFAANLAAQEDTPWDDLVQKFSTLKRLIRFIAYMKRFVGRFRKRNENKDTIETSTELLDCNDLEMATRTMVQREQFTRFGNQLRELQRGKREVTMKELRLFLDHEGLVRCKGRIGNSTLPDEAKEPILLDRKSHVTKLIIMDIHSTSYHTGTSQTLALLRLQYWAPSGRRLVRNTIRKQCIRCRFFEATPFRTPPSPDLPSTRVNIHNAFTHVGVDYFGPLYIQKNHTDRKRWICLFTCASTRAVHLDFAKDLNASTFMEILRKFVANRGRPNTVYSDNAGYFTAKMVQDFAADKGITWKPSLEAAPWFGGFYERLVEITKQAIRKALFKRSLYDSHLRTTLAEIETVINERPLTPDGDDFRDCQYLSPMSFLRPTLSDPSDEIPVTTANDLQNLHRHRNECLRTFWRIWSQDYLLALRERGKTEPKQGRSTNPRSPRKGELVLIHDRNLPRGQWKIGRIEGLRISRDGNTRAADVRLSNGNIIGRSIIQLYPLEYDCEDETSRTNVEAGNVANREESERN